MNEFLLPADNKPVILVVDDAVENLQLLSSILKDDFKIKIAKNGAKAIELAMQEPVPDLILLDVVMPEMDGFEVCKILRATKETLKVPIIFLTSLNEVADETKGFAVGGTDFIPKPINPDIVKARIKTHIELQKERRKSESLLRIVLPDHVINDLIHTGYHKPKILQNVSILFCDFVGFTSISTQLPPEILIEELSNIFGEFDEICARNECMRIKTIGDAYLAASGLLKDDSNHAENLVHAGIEMVQYLENRNKTSDYNWRCRVGINSGSAIAGIVGKTRFIYDILGNDVNIAARVESSGKQMSVTITESTSSLLKSPFVLTSMGMTKLKGAGEMELFTIDPLGADLTSAKKEIFKRLQNELSADYTYHNFLHTLDVMNITKEICLQEKISEDDQLALYTAALYHDTGYLKGPHNHEQASCEIAKETLPKFGYPQDQIEKICHLIMATKIPRNPSNLLEKIICDADLDYLGRDDYSKIADQFKQEILLSGKSIEAEEWKNLQINFFNNHRFYTASSLKHRNETFEKNFTKLKES